MNNPIVSNFNMFMQKMKGQNPNAIIDQLVKSGRISQQQLNQAQEQVKQLEPQLADLKKNFGF